MKKCNNIQQISKIKCHLNRIELNAAVTNDKTSGARLLAQ